MVIFCQSEELSFLLLRHKQDFSTSKTVGSAALEVLNNPKSDPVESVDRSTCWVSSSRACLATQLISNSAFWEDFSGSSLRFHVSSISSFYASGSLKLAFDFANEQTVRSDRIHKCMKVSWMLASKEFFIGQHLKTVEPVYVELLSLCH